jgi:hypothetical protein
LQSELKKFDRLIDRLIIAITTHAAHKHCGLSIIEKINHEVQLSVFHQTSYKPLLFILANQKKEYNDFEYHERRKDVRRFVVINGKCSAYVNTSMVLVFRLL